MPSLGEKILGIILYMIPWSACIDFGNRLYKKYPFSDIDYDKWGFELVKELEIIK